MSDTAPTMPSDKIIDRIKKLHAKAESAAKIGSAAEAEAFAAKVTQMLLEHNLSIAELAVEDQIDDPIDRQVFDPAQFGVTAKKSRILWQETLASAVASANFCRILVHPGRNSLSFIGSKQNREAVMWLYATLAGDLEKTSEKEYVRYFYKCRDEGDVTQARGYRASWLVGAVSAIVKRLQSDRLKALERPTVQALVKRTDIELDNYRDRFEKAAVITGHTSSSLDGLSDGLAYGNAVGLDTDAIREKKRGQRALASSTASGPEAFDSTLDNKLAEIYGHVLNSAGLTLGTRREGVAFNLRVKGFSVITAMETAAARLGTAPTQYTVFSGTLYLSTTGQIDSNPWTRLNTTSQE